MGSYLERAQTSEDCFKYFDKTEAVNGFGVWQILTELTKGERGVVEKLALADKEGGCVGEMLTIANKGGREGLDPLPIFGRHNL